MCVLGESSYLVTRGGPNSGINRTRVYQCANLTRLDYTANCRRMIVELDSLFIVQNILQPLQDKDPVYQVFHGCKQLLKRDWIRFLDHI